MALLLSPPPTPWILMLNSLYNWYLKTFLPFEDPSHPLHYSAYKPECPISEMIDDHYDIEELIGPNYCRKPFGKPARYEQWNGKWYKKAQ